MKLLTAKSQAAEAAERWKKNYFNQRTGLWSSTISGPAKVVYDALIALGPHPEPADVNRVIGNDSWTDNRCNECGLSGRSVVQLGDEPDYDSSTVWVCEECLAAAAAVFQGSK
jgi:hypothetical protein